MFLLVCLIPFAGPATAQGGSVVSLEPEARLVADQGATLSPQGALVALKARGRPSLPYVNLPAQQGAYWLGVPLEVIDVGGSLLFDLGRPHLIEATLWIATRDGALRQVWEHRQEIPASARDVPGRYLAAPVTITDADEWLVLRYRSFAGGWLEPRIGPAAAIADIHSAEDQIAAFLNGILLAVACVAILMSQLVTLRVSLAFVTYLMVGAVFIGHADGYATAYLWPGFAPAEEHVGMVLGVATVASALVFARVLFDTHAHQPRMDRVYRTILMFLCVTAALSLALYGHRWFHILVYAGTALTALLHPLIGILALRAGIRGAWPFLAGSPLIVGSLAYAALAQLAPGHVSMPATLDLGHLTLVAECFAFASAALVRALALREDRDRLLREGLEAERDRMALRLELTDAERRYVETLREADTHRERLDHLRHDIRQPLLGLRAVTSGGDVDAAARAQMADALNYLEDLAGSSERRMQDHADGPGFEIATVCKALHAMFADEAAAKGLGFEVHRERAMVRGNSVPVMRVLSNLVANAIQHSERGTVSVTVASGDAVVHVDVSDTGRGLSAQELEAAWQAGHKGSASEGQGLGLSSVAQIVREHGLDLELTSEPGVGTSARLTLPRAVPPPQRAQRDHDAGAE